ncbi:MAG: Asp/Glu/hydantoin racemase [Planctomycetaceae bacterium]|nr:Asp/Glu/hydantoin racemase [Planctomycetaceae bacterium]|tara:strand:- start:565 stop:2085 length:1521 start_codon:yes stop_codon:yes gene_type:complete
MLGPGLTLDQLETKRMLNKWIVTVLVLLTSTQLPAQDPVKRAAREEVTATYEGVRTSQIRRYPIGVFDSGTGGLTILEQILKSDGFNNRTHHPQGDGKSDFEKESFIFLADQANMPYGNYPVIKKEQFLDDLIVKDADFLLGKEYFSLSGQNRQWSKSPVKAIVIACNTATAYGQADIEQVVQASGLDIKVIGVIDAGAKGAIEVLAQGEDASIAVVPTKGTVLSGAYPRAIKANAEQNHLKQKINVFQQGALGLAGSIDGAREFIQIEKPDNLPRDDYRGPSSDNDEAPIDLSILRRYGFDYSENRLLFNGSELKPTNIQLNSVENYIAYHLTTLMEQMRIAKEAPPLKSVVMGCTHFPFYQDAFANELRRLRNYKENDEYVYRGLMAEKIKLIDPAFFTARELYQSLSEDKRLNSKAANAQGTRGEFYVTVPSEGQSRERLNDVGGFTYEFKYGRLSGEVSSDFRAVPFDESNLGTGVLRRLQERVPTVWSLLSEFREQSDKVK